MKKLTKIISLTLTAVMATAASASAMTFNEPMSFEVTPSSFYKRSYMEDSNSGYSCYGWGTAFKGDKYLDNGYTPTATEENPNPEKIVDTFDGVTQYAHFPANAGNTGYQMIRAMHQWDGYANDSSNYVGSFGKTRYESIFRLNDTRDWTDASTWSDNPDWKEGALAIAQDYLDSNNNRKSIVFRADYPVFDNDSVIGYWLAISDENRTEGGFRIEFNKWYRLRIDVDVQNNKYEVIFDQYRDDQSGSVDNIWTKEYALSDIACAASTTFRWNNNYETMDFGGIKLTRDAIDIKDLTIDDTTNATNVKTSVQVANNAPANDREFTYIYQAPWGGAYTTQMSTLWSYDGDTSEYSRVSKTTSPTLLVAQYDANGKMIGLNYKSEEIPTLGWGFSETVKSAMEGANFTYKTISFDVPKEANYSYAKAFVWNNIDGIVPFTESVDTRPAAN